MVPQKTKDKIEKLINIMQEHGIERIWTGASQDE